MKEELGKAFFIVFWVGILIIRTLECVGYY
jgi:hypothetical protein